MGNYYYYPNYYYCNSCYFCCYYYLLTKKYFRYWNIVKNNVKIIIIDEYVDIILNPLANDKKPVTLIPDAIINKAAMIFSAICYFPYFFY